MPTLSTCFKAEEGKIRDAKWGSILLFLHRETTVLECKEKKNERKKVILAHWSESLLLADAKIITKFDTVFSLLEHSSTLIISMTYSCIFM